MTSLRGKPGRKYYIFICAVNSKRYQFSFLRGKLQAVPVLLLRGKLQRGCLDCSCALTAPHFDSRVLGKAGCNFDGAPL